MRAPLPIDACLPALAAALAEQPRVLLEAPPGSGKTTRVPPALLGEPWLREQRILMLEPRRLAARAACERIASELGQPVGGLVGYRVRFESRVSAATRIEVLTEGLLTRRLQDDPALSGVGLLIFDEFHERHLSSDLGLALALEVQQSLRPDLRLLVMSATLPAERLAAFLGAVRVRGEGASHAVEIRWRPPRQGDWLRALPEAVREALAAGGDVLVFLPGRREIEAAERILAQRLPPPRPRLVKLHGELTLTEQAEVLSPSGAGARIVLATNIAESSLTVPGVRAVVDTGLCREPRFDPESRLSRLVTIRISEASAQQRAGRAGREGPGLCIRLWPREQRLDPEIRPEIRHAELTGLALELAAWGSPALPFLDPPPAAHIAPALEDLRALGALDEHGRMTASGRRMLASGLPPRLAAIALAAEDDIDRALAADLVALLESGLEPLTGEARREADLIPRLAVLAAFRRGELPPDVHRERLRLLAERARRWQQRLRGAASGVRPERERLVRLAAAGFRDRIARVDALRAERFQLVSGLRAEIPATSRLLGERWLIAVALEGEAAQARIRLALPLSEGEALALIAPLREERVELGCERGALAAARAIFAGRLLLERQPRPVQASREGARMLLRWIAGAGLTVLPGHERVERLLRRLALLSRHRPELGPPPDERALLDSAEKWLLPLLEPITAVAELEGEAVLRALEQHLPAPVVSALERDLPERLRLPSGKTRPIDYPEDGEPFLEARIQEFFGLTETPRLLGGRLPLTLHLLSPAGRPLQITRDLASFWREAYPALRRTMKARYPKHAWPEDPLRANPQRGR